jgi:hypothetical protein
MMRISVCRGLRPNSAANSPPTRFWHRQIPLSAGIQNLAQWVDIAGFLLLSRVFWASKMDFSPAGRESRGSAVGWHGDPKLPILAASDIIDRLGMLLPSNRNAVRPDPDVA